MQIKNLSAAQVQSFGEILSAESELLPPCAERWQIRPGADVRELRADGPVVLDYVSGMPLLVIYEKDARSVYYLDRVLALRPGVRFSIAALGSGCDVMDHAVTQMPYAFTVALVSIFCIISATLGFSAVYTIALGALVLSAIILLFGKQP